MSAGWEQSDGLGLPALLAPFAEQVQEHLKLLPYDTGQEIVHQGLVADSFYILASGCVSVVRRTTSGQDIYMGTLQPGDFFGEIGLLASRPRTATVMATEPSLIWQLDREGFLRLIEASPPTARMLQARAVARVKMQAHQARELLGQVSEILMHLRQLEKGARSQVGYSMGIALGDAEAGTSRANGLLAELESLVEVLDREAAQPH